MQPGGYCAVTVWDAQLKHKLEREVKEHVLRIELMTRTHDQIVNIYNEMASKIARHSLSECEAAASPDTAKLRPADCRDWLQQATNLLSEADEGFADDIKDARHDHTVFVQCMEGPIQDWDFLLRRWINMLQNWTDRREWVGRLDEWEAKAVSDEKELMAMGIRMDNWTRVQRPKADGSLQGGQFMAVLKNYGDGVQVHRQEPSSRHYRERVGPNPWSGLDSRMARGKCHWLVHGGWLPGGTYDTAIRGSGRRRRSTQWEGDSGLWSWMAIRLMFGVL